MKYGIMMIMASGVVISIDYGKIRDLRNPEKIPTDWRRKYKNMQKVILAKSRTLAEAKQSFSALGLVRRRSAIFDRRDREVYANVSEASAASGLSVSAIESQLEGRGVGEPRFIREFARLR